MSRSRTKKPDARAIDRYHWLFENSADPILIIEGDRFVDCNQATVEILGYDDKAAVLQCHPSEISPQYQPDGQLSVDKANGILAKAEDTPYQCFEWTHVKADGTLFPVEVSLTAIPNESGFTLHTTWRDISGRKRLEKELRHAQKMDAVGKLAGGIAHDFNNQLVPILGYAELLSNSLSHDSELQEWADEIRHAAGLSALMVDKLLSLSRKESEGSIIVDVDAAVTDLVGILQKLIGEDLTLTYRSAKQPLPVRIARGDIEQIVLNLATNARDAMFAGGSVTISISHANRFGREFACIEVADDGCGMDPETLRHIYEPFFTTKEIGSGTGLGLSMIYDMVVKSGGRIDASSSPGLGTTFEVLIPIAEEGGTTDSHPLMTGDEGNASYAVVSGKHVLVVEDNVQISLFVARVLRDHGFRVSYAEHGKKALELLKTATPDLILTDVIMDEMSGPTMVTLMEESGSTTPVVFMSGHTDDRLTAAGFDMAKLTLLRKPFSASMLIERVVQSMR